MILERQKRGEERERKRERNINVRKKYSLVASCMRPDQVSNRNRLFFFMGGMMLPPTEPPGQG